MQTDIPLCDVRVLCVDNDANMELRPAERREKRPHHTHAVAVPQLARNERAMWLSCDNGQDRWYVYQGDFISDYVNRNALYRRLV